MLSRFPVAGGSRFVDALLVALGQACDGGKKRWYTSTLELQLVSLELCGACRSIPTLHIRVEALTPAPLWSPRKARRRGQDALLAVSRVPDVRAAHWTWALPMEFRVMMTDTSLEAAMEAVQWPLSLRTISFGDMFNQPISGAVWPPSLQQLSFGYYFNQPVAGVVWPASLRQISFDSNFNQPIAGVVWPASLVKLSFGYFFNQPIDGVTWPASLEQLYFGYCFHQPITKAVWPASLQRVKRGGCVMWRNCDTHRSTATSTSPSKGQCGQPLS